MKNSRGSPRMNSGTRKNSSQSFTCAILTNPDPRSGPSSLFPIFSFRVTRASTYHSFLPCASALVYFVDILRRAYRASHHYLPLPPPRVSAHFPTTLHTTSRAHPRFITNNSLAPRARAYLPTNPCFPRTRVFRSLHTLPALLYSSPSFLLCSLTVIFFVTIFSLLIFSLVDYRRTI